ncbi:MAG: c-type cytochrome [Betaproteobacteria bacterium]|nr:c-type cytochrome [Betaproteobacteria bacterium]
MRLLRVIRAVFWSFFGVRRKGDAARDLDDVGPGTMILAGLLAALLLVGAIVALVRFVAADRATSRSAQAPQASPAAPRRPPHGPVVVADTMEERARPCATCHGAETQTTKEGFSPRIAGKPAGYLLNQLASFRDGRRGYPPMVYLVQYMTDDYLRDMAAYFAKLDLPYPPPETPALSVEQSKRVADLVQQGDPARDVPACVSCHGATLSGVEPAIPSLLGLPRQYMNAQFGAWRNGKLRSVEPDCMAEVARRLAPSDVPLVTAWLASQPVPARLSAERRARKLPLECGSVERASAPRPPGAAPAGGRGAYLVAAGDCIACHTAIGGAPYAGGRAIETPFGTVYSSNITSDAATGIGTWSREDFWRALHEGRSKDGRLLYPAFPYPNFTQVMREDADAMFDYLRSLPAVSRANSEHGVRFPYRTQVALRAWRALYFRSGTFRPDESRSAEWNRGAYLVRGLGHCDACHASRNMFGAVSHRLDLGGGVIPMQNWYAPPMAGWEASHIAALLTTGVAPRATAMGPMAEVVFRSTQHLSAEDARAMAAYLHSSTAPPPAAKSVARSSERALLRGAELYGEHCAECHGDRGEGAAPAYPPLAGNPSMNAAVAANGIKAVLNGGYAPVTAANPRPYGMPPYFAVLSDQDVASVLTYVRASWGNSGAPVSALDVERYR